MSRAGGDCPGPSMHLQLVVPGFEHMLHHIQLGSADEVARQLQLLQGAAAGGSCSQRISTVVT